MSEPMALYLKRSLSPKALTAQRGALPASGEWVVELHESLPSTQARAKELGLAGTPRAIVAAACQTEGRGRRGRRWESPEGGLYFSLLYRPRLTSSDLPLLSLAAALAVEAAITTTAGLSVELKWPNDVLKDDLKVCGILSEAVFRDGIFCVTGLGMNLVTPSGLLPPEVGRRAGALFESLPPSETVGALWTATVLHFEGRLEQLEDGRKALLLEDYRKKCASIGRIVRVTSGGEEVAGLCLGVGEEGELLVRTEDGPRSFRVGDVIHAALG
ncbi:MAG: biotin--[acetyl-CoA-carboxylase] ligase [Fretibacterium sp.]|nr:biotin--[acetyl-CoA-carboxylase] ligase [Fretibacterium sp.]